MYFVATPLAAGAVGSGHVVLFGRQIDNEQAINSGLSRVPGKARRAIGDSAVKME
jgi:hypothetical protein